MLNPREERLREMAAKIQTKVDEANANAKKPGTTASEAEEFRREARGLGGLKAELLADAERVGAVEDQTTVLEHLLRYLVENGLA